jgi:hypothetical protein
MLTSLKSQTDLAYQRMSQDRSVVGQPSDQPNMVESVLPNRLIASVDSGQTPTRVLR